MVHPPWDFVAVAVLALLVTWVVSRRAGLRRSRMLASLLVLAGLGFGWFYVEAAGDRAAKDLERLISTMAPTYAAELELETRARRSALPGDDRGREALAGEQ